MVNTEEEKNKGIIRKRKKERKKAIKKGFSECRWFAGILYYEDKLGNLFYQIPKSKIIPKPGRRIKIISFFNLSRVKNKKTGECCACNNPRSNTILADSLDAGQQIVFVCSKCYEIMRT